MALLLQELLNKCSMVVDTYRCVRNTTSCPSVEALVLVVRDGSQSRNRHTHGLDMEGMEKKRRQRMCEKKIHRRCVACAVISLART